LEEDEVAVPAQGSRSHASTLDGGPKIRAGPDDGPGTAC